ncbi:membrane protein, partial [Xanthomonas citri pv. aurantifolii]
MAVLIPACLEADLDAAAGTCTAVIWIPQPSLLPELAVKDAQAIGSAIA